MPRDLAAEQRALRAHPRLEERVADAVDVRDAARARDRVGDRPRGAHVVQDRLARAGPTLAQQRLGQQRREEVPVDERAGVVDEEAAVGVPVPGDPEVGAGLAHLLDDERAVLGQQRVGLVVGEVAVGHPVGLDQIEAEPLEQRPDHRAGHAVAAVDARPSAGVTASASASMKRSAAAWNSS